MPGRKSIRNKSKYEPILDAFLNQQHKIVRVDKVDLDPIVLSGTLKRVIKTKGVENVSVYLRNNQVYLELEE